MTLANLEGSLLNRRWLFKAVAAHCRIRMSKRTNSRKLTSRPAAICAVTEWNESVDYYEVACISKTGGQR
jgi:hypothetical protein